VDIPDQLRYVENHEWAKLDGNNVRVGITDYAQDALGDIVYVELPDVGRELTAGEAFGEIESTKSVSDVYAPVAGTVVEVNSALDDNPEIINSDPYGKGWMLVLETAPGTTLDGLMDASAYEKFTAE
jgi:glycine cleavage system H protein